MSDELMALLTLLESCERGDVSNASNLGLDAALAQCWDEFDGSDEEGMRAHKLHDRMGSVKWEPPKLTFLIERHGGTVKGSSYAERQFWSVDVGEMTAAVTPAGKRRVTPMKKRADIQGQACELAGRIVAGEKSKYLKWKSADEVLVLTGELYPKYSAAEETLRDRRRSLCNYIEEMLPDGEWTRRNGRKFVRIKAG